MNNCSYYGELISRMVDDELTDQEQQKLREHIRQCEDCAALFEAFSSISASIQADQEEPPVELKENIMAEVRRASIVAQEAKRNRKYENASEKVKHKSHWGAIAGLAACVLIAFSIGYILPSPVRGITMGSSSASSAPAAAETVAGEAKSMESAGTGYSDEASKQESNEAPMPAPEEETVSVAESFAADTAENSLEAVANVSRIDIMYNGNVMTDFTMHVGDEPLKLTTQIYPLSIRELASLRSSDESVLIVTDHGDGTCTLVARSSGTAQVIASYAGFEYTCTVFVVNDGGFSIDVGIYAYGNRVYDITIQRGSSIALSAAVNEGIDDGDGTIIWDVDDENIVSLAPYGEWGIWVTGQQAGSTYVYAEINGMKCKCIVRIYQPEG